MTEKILKHELYKHGSYLISLKESGSAFVNIDDEIKKLEELFQLASKKDQPAAFTSEDAMWEYKYNELKALYEQMCQANEDLIQKNNKLKVDHQPTFEVGEYYVSRSGIIYLVTDVLSDHKAYSKALIDGKFSNLFIKTSGIIFKDSKPATAEQIAEFKRAEHFAKHGRKLDEFRVGDKVSIVGTDEIVKIESLRGGAISGTSDLGNSYSISLLGGPTVTLIQTAEELREVGE